MSKVGSVEQLRRVGGEGLSGKHFETMVKNRQMLVDELNRLRDAREAAKTAVERQKATVKEFDQLYRQMMLPVIEQMISDMAIRVKPKWFLDGRYVTASPEANNFGWWRVTIVAPGALLQKPDIEKPLAQGHLVDAHWVWKFSSLSSQETTDRSFDGQMLRLFNYGEPTVAASVRSKTGFLPMEMVGEFLCNPITRDGTVIFNCFID